MESSGADDPLFAYQVPLARRIVSPPDVGARGAAVLDDASGELLFSRDAQRRLPIASTTKIMTALVALERSQPDEVVTVSVSAAELPGSSLMGLTRGERLTMLDLLYGLLLPSGNDAAVAIARAVSGGDDAFVSLMNRRAAELGLADTHFANSHGLDAPDHFSSAADLGRLTRFALRNPTFAQIVATQKQTVRGRITYDLRNTNPLLGRPDVEGVKTGHTELAGACLVAAVRRGGHRVLVVVLASPDVRTETLALADYAFSAYAWPALSLPAGPFDLDPTTGQRAALSQRPVVVLPRWQVPYVRARPGPAPGQASFFVADSRQPIAVAPMVGAGVAPSR